MSRTRRARAAAGLLVLASIVAGCSTGKPDASNPAPPTPVAAAVCATLAANVDLYSQIASRVAQAKAGQPGTSDIDLKAAEEMFTQLEKSAPDDDILKRSLGLLGKEFSAENDLPLGWPSDLATGGTASEWTSVDDYLRFQCDVLKVAAATPTPSSTEGVAPAPTGPTATISYTDADGYQYEADVTFPSVTASSDISKSKPGETEIIVSIPFDYNIRNKTVGRDALRPPLHLNLLWQADSALCKSRNSLPPGTITLGGAEYCTLGTPTVSGPLYPSIPAGGQFVLGTSQGVPEYRWTVAEADQAAVLQDLRGPHVAVISGKAPQAPGSVCPFFDHDGNDVGSSQYYPIWSSTDIGCGTTVG